MAKLAAKVRTQTPPVRCTPEELAELAEVAEAAKVSIAVLIRYRLWGPRKVTGEEAERIGAAGVDRDQARRKGR